MEEELRKLREQLKEEKRLREEEQRRREVAETRALTFEQQTRPTTLHEYIAACHTSVFSRFSIETDAKLTSKGPITNPRDKWCPTNLEPSSDFFNNQRTVLGVLYRTFPLQRYL